MFSNKSIDSFSDLATNATEMEPPVEGLALQVEELEGKVEGLAGKIIEYYTGRKLGRINVL